MILRLLLVGLALIAAFVPLPAAFVERFYTNGVYPSLQNALTSATNRVPVALLDVAAVLVILLFIRSIVKRARKGGVAIALLRAPLSLISIAAVLYLIFVLLWGLNYRRAPLETRLDYERERVNAEAAVSFASTAAGQVNDAYDLAHNEVTDERELARAFADAQRLLGARWQAVPGQPKRSLLEFYFRRAAIDGMTDPFFLEIILNTDVLPFERPFVLAHEWAHLAGYADESEANFVAWVTCLRGDAVARYSGWLAAYQHALGAVPRARRGSLPPLGAGPRADLRAVAERYGRSSAAVRRAARDVYDRYLRANRVEEGIASYDAVVRLLLGTRFDREWQPRLR